MLIVLQRCRSAGSGEGELIFMKTIQQKEHAYSYGKGAAAAMKQALKDHTHWLYPWAGLSVLYILISSAILRADFLYKDDLGRTAEGYRDWYKGSRYISDLLAVMFHTGRTINDISPLLQILSLVLLAGAACILVKVFCQDKEPGWFVYLATVPLAFCPYYLMCLSFKYDAIYMALSVSVCFLPLLLAERKIAYPVCSIIALLIMCLTYQASAGVYPMLVIALAYRRWNQGRWTGKRSAEYVGISVCCYVAALLLYKFVFLRNVPVYVEASMFPWAKLLPGIWGKYILYWKTVYRDFRKLWLLLMAAVAGAYLVSCIVGSKRRRYAALLWGMVTLLFDSLLVYGALIAMQDEGRSPRVMYGLGIILVIMTVSVAIDLEGLLSRLIVFALCWSFAVYAFTYGNDLAQVKRTVQTHTQEVVDDLNELKMINNSTEYSYALRGYIAFPDVVTRQFDGCRMTKRLLPKMGESGWGPYYLEHYFEIHNLTYDSSIKDMDLPIIKDTSFYTIYGEDTRLMIAFH